MLSRPLRSALRFAMAMASALMSAAVTRAAPPLAAFKAKLPVWVKQSSTVCPAATRATARRLYFWSRKKPVFLPVFKVYMVVNAIFADLGLGGFRVVLAG